MTMMWPLYTSLTGLDGMLGGSTSWYIKRYAIEHVLFFSLTLFLLRTSGFGDEL